MEMYKCVFIAILSMTLVHSVVCGTKCVSAKGRLNCKNNASRHMDTEIYLMDDDGFMNNDDTMGWTTTDVDGSFKVEGCGYDFLSDPDPYLKIFNNCNGDSTVTTRVNLPMMFSPDVIDAEEIVLDL